MSVPKLRFKEFDGDWTSSDFSKASVQIIDGDRGLNYPKSDEFHNDEFCLFLNAGNVTKQGFNFENTQFITEEKDSLLRKGKLERNDLVITTRGTVGNVAYFNESVSFNNMRINSGMVIARCQKNVLADFINQFLKSDLFEKWLDKNAFGSAQPQLTVKLLNSIGLNYPSKPEQTKIASFLSAVDEKISQLTQKHELLSKYKQGMMQKLFSQQVRFKADDGSEFGEWALSKLSNYINEFKNTSKVQDEHEVLTSSRKGLIRQAEYFEGSRLVDRENIGYNIIQPNQITYRSRSDDGLFFFNLNKLGITGIISTYYPVFTMKNSDNRFFYEYLNFYKQEYVKYAVGTSQLVLSLNELRNMKFKIPCLEEQTKIANFLSSIDQKIEVVAQQIEQAKQWKKGLLQQMFV